MSVSALREQVAQSIVRLYEMGYVLDQEGNISSRTEEKGRFVITPSQLPRATIRPEDILVVNDQGEVLEGDRNPSIEMGMHLKIYAVRPLVGAVMHFHSLHATALAAVHETIPPFLEELIPFLGADIPTLPYAMAGSEELASSVASALAERNAALLANHGAIVCGSDLQDAFHKAKLLEKVAAIYILAKSLGGPKPLSDSTIETAKEIFRMMASEG